MPEFPGEGHFAVWVLQQQQMVMMFLGKMVHPLTGKAERDLDAARWHIDLLAAMEKRTRGNLEPDEVRLLSQVLTTLRLNFVDEAARPTPAPPDAGDAVKSGEAGAATVDDAETAARDGADAPGGEDRTP
jgi:hypothetical protein